MAHVLIGEVEIAMNREDGTYRLQHVKELPHAGRQLQETVLAESIPEGLRALADEMERQGRKVFGR